MTGDTESTLVICGHGMVSQRLLEALCRERVRPFTRIIVFNGEASAAYNRIQLSGLLAGETDEAALTLQQDNWFRDNGIEVCTGEPVVSINREDRTVTTTTGRFSAIPIWCLRPVRVPRNRGCRARISLA